MIFELEDEELHNIRRHFASFDKDGSGTITFNEITALFHEMGKKFSEADIHETLSYIDQNQDGYVTFHEFLSLYKKTAVLIAKENLIQHAFQACDSDKNGYVTIDELKVMMNQVGEGLNHEELEALIRDADLDGDSKICYEEFIQLMLGR